jgi:hypothetical protein
MAVTRQTYTASPTWTASQLATLFEDAFIDAGLMTAWYDSFLSGVIENRILEVTYDASKAYGKTYYWFMFTTAVARVSVATGWNDVAHVPTGTQYLDFFSTATNSSTNHYTIESLTTGTQVDLVRYTSTLDSDYSWFVLRNSSTPRPFYIAPASTQLVNWLDLDRVFFHHFVTPSLGVSSATAAGYGYLSFRSEYILRRSYCAGGSLLNRTTLASFADFVPLVSYTAAGNVTNNASNYQSAAYLLGSTVRNTTVLAPYGFNNTNPAYATDYQPVMFGYSLSPYTRSDMPNDMAVHFSYTTTSFSYGDRIIVSAGVEEWEILSFANTTINTTASPLLLARVV